MAMWYWDMFIKYFVAAALWIMSIIFIYFNGKKNNKSNYILWMIIDIIAPFLGLVCYLINVVVVKKNTIKEEQ